ncbi:serine protease [Salmonella enterica subsp. enterica serovar Newport]|nr:serine protease [Salmonella enterica subsp. enterica serovar Newport]
MSRVKAWRRTALATYIAAGAALALAGYTVATTAANAHTLRDTRERIEDFQREQTAIAESAISAASVRRGTLPPDTRPHVAPDWPDLAERAMPSVVALSGLEKPYGLAENNHAWLIPGVQQNTATALLTRVRAWHQDWAKEDAKRRQRIMCGGVAVEGNKVLTVAHCVEGQEALRIRTAAGEWREANVIGADLARDVALLEFDGDPLPPIPIATTLPRQGQDVMAIGSPGGYGFAVGVGIVAWYGRDASMLSPDDFMLVTASVIGGNSGGVVVNTRGEAVSLVSYGYGIYTQTIPIDRAMTVAGTLAGGL